MSLWKWNDIELEINMEDVDFQKKYEDAFEKMAEEEKRVKAIGKLSEMSSAYCVMFFVLFDDIFGKGTSDKLFKGKKHTGLVDDCYNSFIKAANDAVKEINKKRAARSAELKKYTVTSKR